MLPPELRLPIYEQVYAPSRNWMYRLPLYCSLLIRNDDEIEWFAPETNFWSCGSAALLRTCRSIYYEAAPTLYAAQTFRILIYPFHGHAPKSLRYSGPFDATNTLLRRIQHLEIGVVLKDIAEFKQAMSRLETLVYTMEGAQANLKTLRFSIRADSATPSTLLESKFSQRLDRMERENGGHAMRKALLRMLRNAQIHASGSTYGCCMKPVPILRGEADHTHGHWRFR